MPGTAEQDTAISPKPLEQWVRDRLPVFARVPLPVEPWRRPRGKDVRLVKTPVGAAVTAEWVPDGTLDNCGPPVVVRRLLPRFLALVTGPPPRVLRFVRDFGPLRLTEDSPFMPAGLPVGAVVPGGSPARAELVADYQRYAGLAACVLRLAAGLRAWTRGFPVPAWPEDIERIREHIAWYQRQEDDLSSRERLQRLPPSRVLPLARPMEFNAGHGNVLEMVCGIVNWWTETAGVRPYLTSQLGGLQQIYYTGRVWGALGLGLTATITQRLEGVTCAQCGRLLKRTRWHAGRALYCQRPACQRATWLEQKRRQRSV